MCQCVSAEELYPVGCWQPEGGERQERAGGARRYRRKEGTAVLRTKGINPCRAPGAQQLSALILMLLVNFFEGAAQSLRRVRLSATPWTVAHQGPLPMGFSRQEYWSGYPFPSKGYLPDPGIEPKSLGPPSLTGGFFTTARPGNPKTLYGAL